jgi:hypothetical protein
MLKPDIWLTSHNEDYVVGKRNRARSEGVTAWVDPEGYRRWVSGKKIAFENEVNKELEASCCVRAVTAVAEPDPTGFRQANVYAVDEAAAPITAFGYAQDAASSPSRSYYISVQLGDRVYVFEDEVEPGQEVPWRVGENPQIKIVSNSIQVKRITGEIDGYALASFGSATIDH